MRQRHFEIIRKPELEGSSFLFNSVRVGYVGTCPETGISFYCNNGKGGVIGVRVYPNKRRVKENATGVNMGKPYSHGSSEYLKFKNAFGHHKCIFASHAVWMAAGRTVQPGMTMDHINGSTTENDIANLRCVSEAINQRDGGFLRKLRNNGINPTDFPQEVLLRFFDKMALYKALYGQHAYLTKLDKPKLLRLLLGKRFVLVPGQLQIDREMSRHCEF